MPKAPSIKTYYLSWQLHIKWQHFADGTEYTIFYMPRSADPARLPPVIVVEVQHTVTRDFMRRAVQYCMNVYKRFHVFLYTHSKQSIYTRNTLLPLCSKLLHADQAKYQSVYR